LVTILTVAALFAALVFIIQAWQDTFVERRPVGKANRAEVLNALYAVGTITCAIEVEKMWPLGAGFGLWVVVAIVLFPNGEPKPWLSAWINGPHNERMREIAEAMAALEEARKQEWLMNAPRRERRERALNRKAARDREWRRERRKMARGMLAALREKRNETMAADIS
jgi:hypothetical protein